MHYKQTFRMQNGANIHQSQMLTTALQLTSILVAWKSINLLQLTDIFVISVTIIICYFPTQITYSNLVHIDYISKQL